MVEVRWRFQHADGTPVSGYVLVTPTVEVVNDNATVTRATIRKALDAAGLMKVDLVANDDPGSDRTDGKYRFEPRLTSGHNPAPIEIQVPASAAGTGIDLPTGDAGPGPTEPVATEVVSDSFAYPSGDLPAPWVQTPTGVWKVDGPTSVAFANGAAGNAVQDTTSRDHRVLCHLKTGGTIGSVSGVILRYKDEQNYISFEYVWTSEESAWSLFIKAANVGREIKLPSDVPLSGDQDHTIQVDALDDTITIKLDEVAWGTSTTLTTAEAAALGATATKAGLISFAGFGNFYDITLYTLAEA